MSRQRRARAAMTTAGKGAAGSGSARAVLREGPARRARLQHVVQGAASTMVTESEVKESQARPREQEQLLRKNSLQEAQGRGSRARRV